MATLILNPTEWQMQAINQRAAQLGLSTHEYVIAVALGNIAEAVAAKLETPEDEADLETKTVPPAPADAGVE